MAKPRRKLTPAQKKAKRERKKKYELIFVNGKQKRVLRRPQIDGMNVDDYILRNADPVWLHQNGTWEYMDCDAGTGSC